jgi:myo-inositol-1(or 4)-monophosphatase
MSHPSPARTTLVAFLGYRCDFDYTAWQMAAFGYKPRDLVRCITRDSDCGTSPIGGELHCVTVSLVDALTGRRSTRTTPSTKRNAAALMIDKLRFTEARRDCQMKSDDDLLKIACDATQIGAITLETSNPGTVHHKGDRDLVTDIDLMIQRDIDDYLRRATPDIPLLAEESPAQPDIDTTEWLWVLDPIDGTSNFVHGLALCSVSLALLHRGDTVVAVTHAPLLGRRYHAVKNRGAFLNGQPINVSGATRLAEAIVSLGDYAVGHDAAALNESRLAITAELVPRAERIRMVGAATLDLAFVAEGALDACVMMSNKPWDTAAGTLIAREAGARLVDARGNPHTHRSAETIATTPGIARELGTVIETACAPGVLQATGAS